MVCEKCGTPKAEGRATCANCGHWFFVDKEPELIIPKKPEPRPEVAAAPEPVVRMTPSRRRTRPAPKTTVFGIREGMLKKILFFGGLGIALLAIIIFMTCFMSESSPLAGYAWNAEGTASQLVYAFIDDENGYIERRSEFVAFTYTTDGNKLIIRTEEEETYRYEYAVSGISLTLKDLDGNQDKTMTKQGRSESGVPFICEACKDRTVGKKYKAKQQGETLTCCADCKERLDPIEEEP